MRVLGVDFGTRRIGLALSDHSAILARPWQTIEAGPTPAASARVVAQLLERGRTSGDDEATDVGAIVVGLPRRLNGADNDQTQLARDFASALAELTRVQVRLQDERLSTFAVEDASAEGRLPRPRTGQPVDHYAAMVILEDALRLLHQ